MKKPRDIDWCYVTSEMIKDPAKKLSEHLPDKIPMTVLEWLLYQQHVHQCEPCKTSIDKQELPPKKIVDDTHIN